MRVRLHLENQKDRFLRVQFDDQKITEKNFSIRVVQRGGPMLRAGRSA